MLTPQLQVFLLPFFQVDFTSCTGLFCVLGIVLMVTGIVTSIVLAFKYVSVLPQGQAVNLASRLPVVQGWALAPTPLHWLVPAPTQYHPFGFFSQADGKP